MIIPQQQVLELNALLLEKNVKIRFKENGYDVWWHGVAAWFVTVMFWIFRKVSFGKFDHHFDEFTTTFGRYIYLGIPESDYDPQDMYAHMILRHELIHVYQSERYGAVLYAFLYLMCLPAVWTFRSKLELEAYTQNMLVHYEVRGFVPLGVRKGIVKYFTGPTYLFMRPFPSHVAEEVHKIAQDIEEGEITGLWPDRPEALSP